MQQLGHQMQQLGHRCLENGMQQLGQDCPVRLEMWSAFVGHTQIAIQHIFRVHFIGAIVSRASRIFANRFYERTEILVPSRI